MAFRAEGEQLSERNDAGTSIVPDSGSLRRTYPERTGGRAPQGLRYLTDIVHAADYIAEFIAGTDSEQFQKSELLRSDGRNFFGRQQPNLW
jgi:hypothetical protein